MGPVTVTDASGTVALVVSWTIPPRAPRAVVFCVKAGRANSRQRPTRENKKAIDHFLFIGNAPFADKLPILSLNPPLGPGEGPARPTTPGQHITRRIHAP